MLKHPLSLIGTQWQPWSYGPTTRLGELVKQERENHSIRNIPNTAISDEESETESFSLDEWLQWIPRTDTIIKDNDPSEAGADLQEETGLSDVQQTHSLT